MSGHDSEFERRSELPSPDLRRSGVCGVTLKEDSTEYLNPGRRSFLGDWAREFPPTVLLNVSIDCDHGLVGGHPE